MTDRLPLLRAILADPAADTPRLVYADWLDEHGTTDADAARAEYIRFWFTHKPNLRATTKALATWLRANWPRLWPSSGLCAGRVGAEVHGRVLETRVGPVGCDGLTLRAHFDRGFATRVEVSRGPFERYIGPLAVDEPLARFEPDLDLSWEAEAGWKAAVSAGDWGPAVFDRLAGYDRLSPIGAKVYGGSSGQSYRQCKRALGDVMTAIAREANGLA